VLSAATTTASIGTTVAASGCTKSVLTIGQRLTATLA
jgi:hypothetical protein